MRAAIIAWQNGLQMRSKGDPALPVARYMARRWMPLADAEEPEAGSPKAAERTLVAAGFRAFFASQLRKAAQPKAGGSRGNDR